MGKDPNDYALHLIHEERLAHRQIDELIGLIKGALLDRQLVQMEAEGLLSWLNAHVECLDTWPASVLYDRLRAVLNDGRLDPEERDELFGVLMQIVSPQTDVSDRSPTTLPLSLPPFDVSYPGRTFCFTGVFEFGSRSDCHQAVFSRGGVPANGVTKKLNYLVIGTIGSEFWKHSSFGTKIMKAVEYRDAGSPIVIMSESQWVTHLG